MKALLAAAVLSASTCAMAGTVLVSNTTHKDPTGFGTAFTDSSLYSFTLDTDTWFSGLLNTKGALSAKPATDIQSVTLSNLTTGEKLDWSELIAVNWSATHIGAEQWAMPSRELSAGLWELSVSGITYSNKQGNGYTVSMELPEPDSAALAAVAVVGAFLSIRRRKSA